MLAEGEGEGGSAVSHVPGHKGPGSLSEGTACPVGRQRASGGLASIPALWPWVSPWASLCFHVLC